MSNIIYRELLSLVLDCNIRMIINQNNDLVCYAVMPENGDIKYNEAYFVNTDTLGRLCKEWLKNEDFYNSSGNTYKGFECMIGTSEMMDNEILERFCGKTELETIIKATEWVAKEKGLL